MTKPVSGREMRRAREEGIVITLSSGVAVAIRPVPLTQLLLSGSIPDSLSAIAASSIMEPGEPPATSDAETVKKYIELENMIVRLALVHPKIVDNPKDDDECTLSEFSDAERGEIFALSKAATERLRRFRDQQSADVADLSEVQDV